VIDAIGCNVQIIDTTSLDPVGLCIYCGSANDLRDEHVVPFALNGNLILPASTCKDCADMTSRIELDVLKGFMLAARTVAGFATRRPNNRPSGFELEAEIEGKLQTRWLSSNDFPALLVLPVFRPPGIVDERSDPSLFPVVGTRNIIFGRNPLLVAKQLLATKLRLTGTIPVGAYTRFLAKIAYSYSVGVRGSVNIASSTVLPFLRGEADDGAKWIGSSDFEVDPALQGATHTLKLATTSLKHDPGSEIEVVQMRLFANSGGPGYEVVVGLHEAGH